MKKLHLFILLFFTFFLFTGCIKVKHEYYGNGKLKSKTHYRCGKETGTTTYYHSWYATKTMEIEMKRGKKNGKLIKRYFDGNIELLAIYKEDRLEGVETYFYQNGNRNLETHYTNGIKNGPVTSWYSSGEIKESGAFVDDLFDGIWENYDPRGLLTGEGFFVKGIGKRITYDEVGRILCETNFVNNKKEGLETSYLPDGQIEKTYLFKEDRIIEINGVPLDSR